MKNSLLTIFGLILLFSCSEKKQTVQLEHFGDTINTEKSVSLKEAINELKDKDSVQVKIKGKVSDVCKKKGCWMALSEDGLKDEVRVSFKDYSFFVPMNSEKRTTYCEGWLKKTTQSVEELKHYAKDDGKSEAEIAKITKPENTYEMVAHGVAME